MPAVDLTGQRFGRLTAHARNGSAGGQAVWQCRCDCGTVEPYPSHRLTGPESRRDTVRACTACRLMQPCIVCGRPFLARHRAVSCSAECATAHGRAIGAARAARRRAALIAGPVPDLHQRIVADRHARALAMQSADPAAAAAERERMRLYWTARNDMRAARRAADPAEAERHLVAKRAAGGQRALKRLTQTGAALAERLEESTDE